MLGKKFRTNAVVNKQEFAPDPLLSQFINGINVLDPKVIQQDECFGDDASDVKRYTPFWSEFSMKGLSVLLGIAL